MSPRSIFTSLAISTLGETEMLPPQSSPRTQAQESGREMSKLKQEKKKSRKDGRHLGTLSSLHFQNTYLVGGLTHVQISGRKLAIGQASGGKVVFWPGPCQG